MYMYTFNSDALLSDKSHHVFFFKCLDISLFKSYMNLFIKLQNAVKSCLQLTLTFNAKLFAASGCITSLYLCSYITSKNKNTHHLNV